MPPLVFSEAMRDVDLFVGVTSIAADPDWTDRGAEREYWQRAGFGELTESAEVRREALRRIVPRLRSPTGSRSTAGCWGSAATCGTYRIHLGSANILMEPDDAYLCIVASRGKATARSSCRSRTSGSALILSKAFLLAGDSAITDPGILRQIKRGA